MKLFVTTQFTGHWPVGVSAIIFAKDAKEAAKILNKELKSRSLKGDATEYGMIEVKIPDISKAIILNDGDY